jgi:hypothetical protein
MFHVTLLFFLFGIVLVSFPRNSAVSSLDDYLIFCLKTSYFHLSYFKTIDRKTVFFFVEKIKIETFYKAEQNTKSKYLTGKLIKQ